MNHVKVTYKNLHGNKSAFSIAITIVTCSNTIIHDYTALLLSFPGAIINFYHYWSCGWGNGWSQCIL